MFDMKYDILVVAIGSENNTFNTPGVDKHAHFLKELRDARRIRSAISDAFESAMTPAQSTEERKRLLHFVVVGGGPTGVEFAAEVRLNRSSIAKFFNANF
jgi:NADH:ubiquinone reductase (non-electrogenic)